jgi:hypothetical protein
MAELALLAAAPRVDSLKRWRIGTHILRDERYHVIVTARNLLNLHTYAWCSIHIHGVAYIYMV